MLQFNDSHSSICNKHMQSKVGSKNKSSVANEMLKVVLIKDISTVSNDVTRKISQWLSSYHNKELC